MQGLLSEQALPQFVNEEVTMTKFNLTISVIVLALLLCSCSLSIGPSLNDLPGRSYSVGTYDIKPMSTAYTTQPTGEHVLALSFAYESLVPGDYPADLFTVFGQDSTLTDASGTLYRPIKIFALPCFPDGSGSLFDQFNSGIVPCQGSTALKVVMITYAAVAQPTTNLTFTMDNGQTKIAIAGPESNQVAGLQGGK
jgi:hypothetical protein